MLYVISRCLQCYSDKCFKKFSCWEKRGVTLTDTSGHWLRKLKIEILKVKITLFMFSMCWQHKFQYNIYYFRSLTSAPEAPVNISLFLIAKIKYINNKRAFYPTQDTSDQNTRSFTIKCTVCTSMQNNKNNYKSMPKQPKRLNTNYGTQA